MAYRIKFASFLRRAYRTLGSISKDFQVFQVNFLPLLECFLWWQWMVACCDDKMPCILLQPKLWISSQYLVLLINVWFILWASPFFCGDSCTVNCLSMPCWEKYLLKSSDLNSLLLSVLNALIFLLWRFPDIGLHSIYFCKTSLFAFIGYTVECREKSSVNTTKLFDLPNDGDEIFSTTFECTLPNMYT